MRICRILQLDNMAFAGIFGAVFRFEIGNSYA